MEVKKYLSGKFSRNELTRRYLPFMMGIFWGCLLMAWLLFPPELQYSMFERSISNLGSYQETPGALFFSIGIIAWGIMLIPLFLFYYRRFSKICKLTSAFGTFLGLIGSIFIIAIGIISDDHRKLWGMDQARVHVLIAAIGIIGIGMGMLVYYLPIFKDTVSKRGHRQFSFLWVSIAYGLIFLGGMGMGIAEIIKSQQDIGWPGPGFLSFTFWEWILLITFNVFILLMGYKIMPEEVKELKLKRK